MPINSLRKPYSLAVDVYGVCGLLLCFSFSPFFLKMSKVNIASMNINGNPNLNGAREIEKRAEIFEVVKQKKIDVVMLRRQRHTC